MPYYMGDYYAGDPGFFSFLGKAARGVGKLFGGGRMRRVAQLPDAGGAIVRSTPPFIAPGGGTLTTRAGQIIRAGGQAIRRHPVLSAAGAAGTAGVVMGEAAGAVAERRAQALGMMPAGFSPRGFHVSKKTGLLVRNRRMRVTNPKALRRAIRRCTGFGHLARKVLRFTSPRAPRGRMYFRTKKRTSRKIC